LVIDDGGPPLDTRNKTTVLISKTNAGNGNANAVAGEGGARGGEITLSFVRVLEKK